MPNTYLLSDGTLCLHLAGRLGLFIFTAFISFVALRVTYVHFPTQYFCRSNIDALISFFVDVMVGTMMTARRRRLRPDDPFFAAGNEIALRDAFTQVFFYTVDHKEPSSYYDAMRPNSYPCSAHGCHQVFESLEECDLHYFNTHTRECAQCRAVLPNDHLLDLHISEAHDSYFATALQRGKASFACLVATCNSSFECEKDRHRHLVEAHLYPRWFRFHHRMQMVETSLQNKKGQRGHKRRGGKGKTSNASELEKSYEERKQRQIEKKKARKERQKRARAVIPCKFHLMEGGCERGERCDFLHSVVPGNESAASSNVRTSISDADMAIDALSNQLEGS